MAKKCFHNLSSFGIKCPNLGAFLENTVHWKSKLSKYGIAKSLSPIFVFFNKIFFCKDSADFWHRNFAIFDLQYQIKSNT